MTNLGDYHSYDDMESSHFWRQFFTRINHEWGCLFYHGIGPCTCTLRGDNETMTNPESKAASILGRKGGRSTSDAKVQASRDNGKLGGRPKRFRHYCSRCGLTWFDAVEQGHCPDCS